MPKVRIEILSGRSVQYKKDLMNAVHTALLEAFRIHKDDRTIRLYELDPEHFDIPGNKTTSYTHIEITLFKGRSLDTKRKLYQMICKNLQESNQIEGNDIAIILIECPLENWGIRGGIPASEVDLGFDVNI